MRLSKTAFYERPYNFTGVIKHTGPKDTPKGIWKDRNIGTWKGWNVELLQAKKRLQGKVIITCIYPTESGGKSEEVVIINYGAIATSHLSTIKYKYLVSKVRV